MSERGTYAAFEGFLKTYKEHEKIKRHEGLQKFAETSLLAWWKSRVPGLPWYVCEVRSDVVKLGDELLHARMSEIRQKAAAASKCSSAVGGFAYNKTLKLGFIQIAEECCFTMDGIDSYYTGFSVQKRRLSDVVLGVFAETGFWVDTDSRVLESEVVRFVPNVKECA